MGGCGIRPHANLPRPQSFVVALRLISVRIKGDNMTPHDMAKPRTSRPLFSYWFPGIVLASGALGVGIICALPLDEFDRRRRALGILFGLPVIFMLLALWLFGFSGFPWRQRLTLFLGSLLVLIVAGWASIRGVQFSGSMRPIVHFRWDPDRDAILEAHRRQQTVAAVAVALDPSRARENDFPEYRGRLRDGVVHGPTLARDWTVHPPRLLWRQPVGGGYAAFAVAGNVAVTIEQRRDREAVVCYDTATGKECWVHDYPAHFSERLGGDGPRATPTIALESVFSLGAAGQLVCLELSSGRLKWQANVLEDNDNLPWGMCGSPLVYDRVVVVNPGSQRSTAAGRAVVAYDRATGRQVWSTGSTKAGYSSPMLANLAGHQQLLLLDGEIAAGYDLPSGHELWRFPWPTYLDINVAQPVVLEGDRVFISSGYDTGCVMLRISESAGEWKVEPIWQNKMMRCKFTSPVSYKGFLYGLDEGILSCVDQETGKRKWRDGRYGHGQLLRAEDLLIILSENGKLAIVEATPNGYRELGSISALEGKTWNNPAVADRKAFLRNSEEMACYELPHD
jgi:outer membrane protein assembly factor BamB